MIKKGQEFWISELYKWADDNNIPELEYYEDIYEEDSGELDDCRFWVGLPRDVNVLLSLEELNLSWHNCVEIPEQIRHLTKLKKLSFAKQPDGLQPTFYQNGDGVNKVSEIPDWISELENLELLDLSGNAIKIVPKSIFQLRNLKRLYLHENEIMLIASNLGVLHNLEVLWVQDNLLYEFKCILEELINSEDLNVILIHENLLNVLTENIIKLKSLSELWFDARISPFEPIKGSPGNWKKFFSEVATQVPLKDD